LILKVKIVEKEDGRREIVFYVPEGEEEKDERVVAEKEVDLNGEGEVFIEITGDEEIEVKRVRKLKIDEEVLKEIEKENSNSLDQDQVN